MSGIATTIAPETNDTRYFVKKYSFLDTFIIRFLIYPLLISSKYEPAYAREQITAALKNKRGEEKQRQRALIGPHHDAIHYYLDGKDASLYGSQGQQRSIVLAYRLAELALIEEILHQRPVLLLDDVMSELDAKRRRELMKFIPTQTQVFITTTTLGLVASNCACEASRLVVRSGIASAAVPYRSISSLAVLFE